MTWIVAKSVGGQCTLVHAERVCFVEPAVVVDAPSARVFEAVKLTGGGAQVGVLPSDELFAGLGLEGPALAALRDGLKAAKVQGHQSLMAANTAAAQAAVGQNGKRLRLDQGGGAGR